MLLCPLLMSIDVIARYVNEALERDSLTVYLPLLYGDNNNKALFTLPEIALSESIGYKENMN